jgi:DNA-binding response OmpR family regulator
MRILAVDDDVVIRELLEVFLSSIDYSDVIFAQNGSEALEILENSRRPFDCILLDIEMPQINGIELIPRIRAFQGYEFVPILMLTRLDDRDYISKAFVAGAWDYIVKPFEAFELETRIHGAELRSAEMRRLSRRPDPNTLEMAVSAPKVGQAESGLVFGPAMENCVQRLSASRAGELGVLTVTIGNYAALSAEFDEDRMKLYLNEIANNLTQTFSEQQVIVSYRGDGAFVVLSFMFDHAQRVRLDGLARSAVRQAGASVFEIFAANPAISVDLLLSSELPEDVEPLYLLHAVNAEMPERARVAR